MTTIIYPIVGIEETATRLHDGSVEAYPVVTLITAEQTLDAAIENANRLGNPWMFLYGHPDGTLTKTFGDRAGYGLEKGVRNYVSADGTYQSWHVEGHVVAYVAIRGGNCYHDARGRLTRNPRRVESECIAATSHDPDILRMIREAHSECAEEAFFATIDAERFNRHHEIATPV